MPAESLTKIAQSFFQSRVLAPAARLKIADASKKDDGKTWERSPESATPLPNPSGASSGHTSFWHRRRNRTARIRPYAGRPTASAMTIRNRSGTRLPSGRIFSRILLVSPHRMHPKQWKRISHGRTRRHRPQMVVRSRSAIHLHGRDGHRRNGELLVHRQCLGLHEMPYHGRPRRWRQHTGRGRSLNG